MRRNAFNETYCHTAAEARSVIDDSENGWDVYVSNLDVDEESVIAEVAENESGDLVCFIEGDTEDAVKAIITELKIDTL